MIIIIVTAVETSNLTYLSYVHSSSAFMPVSTASLTNIMVWNAEPHMTFQMCLPQEGLIYFQILQLFSDLVGLPPNGDSIECHYFQRSVN
jgi:hypothetical protein